MTTQTKKKRSTSHKVAKEYFADYIKAKKAKAKLDARMKDAKAYLEAYADDETDNFDEKGNLEMNGGYLHLATKTEVVGCETFDISEFMKDFPELVDHKFKTAAIKAILKSEAGTEKLTNNHCVTLDEVTTLEIVIK